MCSLPNVTGREAIATFERAGFQVCRIEGSHHIMKREGHRYLLSVPVHGNRTLPRGTLRRLIHDAGLTAEEFNRLRD